MLEAENQLMPARANHPSDDTSAAASQLSISAEWLAYLALAAVALLLRVAELDAVPLSDYEAQQALHAWHSVQDDAPGAFAVSNSPITYLTQLLTFSTLGASEFSTRIGTALAGALLALSPLLFRQSIGKTRSFVWAVLLSVLTIPVTSSRFADGTAWMMLFTVLAIWMIRRYWYSNQLSDAIWASAFVTLMLLLSSPAGIPLLLILLAAGWLAVWRTALSAPQRLNLPGDDILQSSLKRLIEFPFLKVAFVPVAVVVITATGFMLNPAGLGTVSQLIHTALSGLTQAGAADGARSAFVALLTYEPLLMIFALGGAWLLWKHGDVTYIDRFAAAWALIAGLGLILYPGAKTADAMWAAAPLSLLASYGITELMVNRLVIVLWPNSDDDYDDHAALYSTRYWWVKWVISLGALLFLFILSVQFLQVARAMLLPQTASSDVFSHAGLVQGLGLMIMTAVIIPIVYLLVIHFWGHGTTLQGIGLGFVWFMLLSGMGGAWNTAVVRAHNPAELWHPSAAAKDAYLLRETLFELADLDSKGFPLFKFSIVTDQAGIINSNGLIAWLVRDFPNARFVSSVKAAAGERMILMAQGGKSQPELGGDYVGQRFVLRRSWSIRQLGSWDWPAWWSHRRLRSEQQAEEAAVLWLRQDVYDGIPAARQ